MFSRSILHRGLPRISMVGKIRAKPRPGIFKLCFVRNCCQLKSETPNLKICGSISEKIDKLTKNETDFQEVLANLKKNGISFFLHSYNHELLFVVKEEDVYHHVYHHVTLKLEDDWKMTTYRNPSIANAGKTTTHTQLEVLSNTSEVMKNLITSCHSKHELNQVNNPDVDVNVVSVFYRVFFTCLCIVLVIWFITSGTSDEFKIAVGVCAVIALIMALCTI